ncbi:MAG: PQQ-binding-like beta-propeller repeat protein, partial [Halanaerobiales bacterium]
MKKCLALGVIILLIFVFAGCDSGPEEEEYTLEISVVGNGSVSVDGVEIDDDETETFNYDETTSVPLEVSPDDDYIADWSGDTDKITDEGDILVDGDVSLTVTFQVDAETLKVINSIDADQVKRTAAVTDDLVIVPGGDKLRVLDKDTMEEEWSYDAGAEITTSPLVDEDGVIYIGTAEKVIALEDNEVKWENKEVANLSNTDSGFALVLADESESGKAEIIVGSSNEDEQLYSLDAETGKALWDKKLKGSVLNNPAVDSDREEVYVAAGEEVVAYDLETKDEKWTVDENKDGNIDAGDFDIIESSPAVGEDMLY